MTLEALAFEAAARVGVPEPAIVVRDDSFLIMERVEGETIARRILRDEQFAEVRPRLAEQCGEILARIHSIPPDAIPGLDARDPLARHGGDDPRVRGPEPGARARAGVARAQPPRAAGEVVLHGDFRLGNLIIGQDGVRAVLDWELVHRGDPMQDLGYLCVRAWRFGGEHPVGGFGTYEDLFRGYERVSGREVDRQSGSLVGGVRHRLVGRRVHAAGVAPPFGLRALGRARGDRPARVGAGVRRAAGARIVSARDPDRAPSSPMPSASSSSRR